MNAFSIKATNNSAREVLTKNYLVNELRRAIKDLQREYVGKEDETLVEGNRIDYLCQCVEALFIHSIKATIASRLTSVFSHNEDQMPEPDFWPLIKLYTPKYLLSKIKHLSQIDSNVGKCRSWIRIAINERVIASFIETIAKDKANLSSFYKPTAFFRDAEQPYIVKQLLEGLINFEFKINYNMCILNVWEPYTLTMAGLWIPAPTPEPIMPAIDVINYFSTADLESQNSSSSNVQKSKTKSKNTPECKGKEASSPPEENEIQSEIYPPEGILNNNEEENSENPLPKEEDLEKSSSLKDSNDNIDSNLEKIKNTTEEETGFDSGFPEPEIYGNRLSPKGGWSSSFEVEGCSSLDDQSFDSLLQSYGPIADKCESTVASTPDFTEIVVTMSSKEDNTSISSDTLPKSSSTSGENGFEVISPNFAINSDSKDNDSQFLLNCLKYITCEKGLDQQHYKCYDCERPIGMIYGKTRLCHFTGYHYCTECHENDEALIPARMVHNWDFRKYTISRQAKEFLEKVENTALLDMKELNPLIYAVVPEMAHLQSLRTQLGFLQSYLFTCRNSVAQELRKKVWPREHLYEHIHLYSCTDLIQAPSGFLSQVISRVIAFARKHVDSCTLCSQKGFICEVCSDPKVIYPFDIESTYRCERCLALYHATCMDSNKTCPKCERRQKRLEIICPNQDIN